MVVVNCEFIYKSGILVKHERKHPLFVPAYGIVMDNRFLYSVQALVQPQFGEH